MGLKEWNSIEKHYKDNKKFTEDEINFFIRYEVGGYWNEIDIWFSNAVGRPCTLIRSYAAQNEMGSNREQCMLGMCRDVETRLNFVNEAQFLLTLEESVSDLNDRLRSSMLHALFIQSNFLFILEIICFMRCRGSISF